MLNRCLYSSTKLASYTSIVFLALCVMYSSTLYAQDDSAKYEGAIYKESDVPNYTLAKVLKTFSGDSIYSVPVWEEKRRPEILQFFEENMYGKIPELSDPIAKTFELISEDPHFLEGLCTRREVRISFANKRGKVDMPMILFIPNKGEGPYPAIYWVNLLDIKQGRFEMEGPQRFGQTQNHAPIKQLMLRGIALASIDVEALGSRSKSRSPILNGGIIDLHFQKGQTNPRKDEWGLIGVWAYAAISGMDYLMEDADIHPDQVAIMGSSIGGKIAIWAAAQDERMGMVLSATSGHGGDALWKRQAGETLDNMLEWLPRWLGRNAQKYAGKIDNLPLDQHALLACLAPRPIYISTAVHDLWADPQGQWLGALHAAPAYQLYGKDVAFYSGKRPPLNQAIVKSSIGYHIRSGFHGLKLHDWERFMEFIEYHFLKIPIRSVHEVYYPDGKWVDHYPGMDRASRE